MSWGSIFAAALLIEVDGGLWLWLGVIGFSFAAGYLLGGTTPHWGDDRVLEDADGFAMNRYGYGYRHGCSPFAPGMMFNILRRSSWAAIVFGALALALTAMATGPEALDPQFGDFYLFFSKPFWMALGSAGLGYVLARLTDKGPVGPLE